MTELVLDPGDGRDAGMRLARHVPLRLPGPRPHPAAGAVEALTQTSRRLCDGLLDQVQRLADAGLRPVGMQVGNRWVVDGGQMRYFLDAVVACETRHQETP